MRRRRLQARLTSGMCGVLTGWAATASLEAATYYPPPESQGGWRTLVTRNVAPSPEQKAVVLRTTGLDTDELTEAWKYVESLDRQQSLLAIRHGWIAAQWDHVGIGPINSATKSLTGLALARAMELSDAGRLPKTLGYESLAYQFLPPAWGDSDPCKKRIKVRSLPTMCSGLEAMDMGLRDVNMALALPVVHPTETVDQYSSAALMLEGMVIENATGQELSRFFREQLSDPIGAESVRLWDAFGAAGWGFMNTRDFARFGYLMLWNGAWDRGQGRQQLVRADLVGRCREWPEFLRDVTDGPGNHNRWFTTNDPPSHLLHTWNGWWINWSSNWPSSMQPVWSFVPKDAFSMSGYGKDICLIIPSLDLVIAHETARVNELEQVLNAHPEFFPTVFSKLMAAVVAPAEGRRTQPWTLTTPGSPRSTATATGPLRVHPTNPRYFTDGTTNADGSLRAVYLTGSHTWGNLCDYRTKWPAFDFAGYLDFLERHHHNFIRLWTGDGLGHQPTPYARTGPGTALDGGPKVDLDQFDPAFFDRLRSRVIAARDRGVYVGIMLFSPDSGAKREDWGELLFNPTNNIQGINWDTNGDGAGAEAYDLSIPRITAYQEAYVRRLVDTVNDLDNVLYEIGNEGDLTSVPWQYHFIRFIRQYEAGKPKQHPIGMTAVFNILNGSWAADNRVLFDSPADWISPGLDPYKDNPPAADGRKVIIADVDHIWPTRPHPGWVWECFLRGIQPILMDTYCYGKPEWTSPEEQEAMRKQMGCTLEVARKVNLAVMTPRPELASTRYCLAKPGYEYLVYQPKAGEPFSVELKAATFEYEWFDPAKGAVVGGGRIESTGGKHEFAAPFAGAAVLYLKLP